jgi:hypothetical protein
MHLPVMFVLAAGLVGGAAIHVRPAPQAFVPPSPVSKETSLVVPAGARLLTRLGHALSVRAVRPGDTIYLRVAAPLTIGGQAVVAAGSYVEVIVNNVPEQASAGRIGPGVRLRRLITAQGDIADVFVARRAPSDSMYRRGVLAVADLPGRDQVVTMAATVALVVEDAFTVDTRRSLARAFGRRVRVVGSPPRIECLVEAAAAPGSRIPGTPPTPAIGDIPGTPGTPDIVLPETPGIRESWQLCR